jgi:hypothetical protein
VQCALSRGLMKRPTWHQAWLRGTKVVIDRSDAPDFNEWYALNLGTVIAGKQLFQWMQSASTNDKLPQQICGTSASASGLQRQVFRAGGASCWRSLGHMMRITLTSFEPNREYRPPAETDLIAVVQ